MGRKRTYDEDQVLDSAMVTFWEKGYKNTSIRVLEENMGINQFSIYASFKSKKNLFKKALQRYEHYIYERFLTDLKQENATLRDIESFLLSFSKQIKTRAIPNSCLMVNTTSELTEEDADIQQSVILFFDKMKGVFKNALENSLQNKVLPAKTNIDQSAEYLVGIAQSISIYAKIKNQQQIKDYIHFAMTQLKK